MNMHLRVRATARQHDAVSCAFMFLTQAVLQHRVMLEGTHVHT